MPTHLTDSVVFKEERLAGPVGGSVSRFAGMPLGVQTLSDWYLKRYLMGDINDQQLLVDNPAAPAGGDGAEWEYDDIANGATLSFVLNTFPPRFQAVTGAVDGDGFQMQASANGAVMYAPAAIEALYFEIIFRIQDANDGAATITQTEFFFGFGPEDTTFMASPDDGYVGLYKPDASTVVQIVGDDANVALASAGASVNLVDLSSFSSAGDNGNSNGELVKLSFLVEQIGTDAGRVWGWADNGLISLGPTHRASLDLGDNVFDQPVTPTIAFETGQAVAKTLQIANLIHGARFVLG